MESAARERELLQFIIEGMQDKKAHNICLLNLEKIHTAVADYFLVCSGLSPIQVVAIAEGVIEKANLLSQTPWKKEGFLNREWIILDYVAIVVHIFQEQQRGLYALEALWGDATIKHF